MSQFLDIVLRSRLSSKLSEGDEKLDNIEQEYTDLNHKLSLEILRKFWEMTEDFMDHPKLMTEIIAMRAINMLVDKHCKDEGLSRNEKETNYESIVESLSNYYDDEFFKNVQAEELKELSTTILEGLLELMSRATGLHKKITQQ